MADDERLRQSHKLDLRAIAHAFIPSLSIYKGGQGEGTNLVPRPLWMQEILLRFKSQLLDKQVVLNFGCGNDIAFMNGLAKEKVQPKKIYRVDANPALAINGVLITDGEDLSLHIQPKSVDISLALFVMHQIPFPNREKVYQELLKVTRKAIHIGPIYGADFDLFQEDWFKKSGFDIVSCHPFQEDDGFMPKKWADYDHKIKEAPDKRITRPKREYPYLIRVFGMRHLAYEGGSYIILMKK